MKQHRLIIALIGLMSVMACGSNPEDPLEPMNRGIHEFNKVVDRAILKPVSEGYDAVIDDETQTIIANFSGNLSEPKNFVNHVLQGDLEGARVNLYRFFANTMGGMGGFGDVASLDGHFPKPTGLNQTLAVWGVPEGPYIEAPILGPNTARSLVALVGDRYMDPLPRALNADQREVLTYFEIVSRINDRARYGKLIDLILYQSADSYLATRLAYLQRQRAQVEQAQPQGDGGDDTVELENFYEFE